MTAAPVETGAALGEGALTIDPDIVGPASPYPRVAEVRELRPDTITDSTDTFSAVTDEEILEDNVAEPEPEPEPVESTPDFTRPISVAMAAPPAPRPQRTELRFTRVMSSPKPEPTAVSTPDPAPALGPAPRSEPVADTLTVRQAIKHRIAGTRTTSQEGAEEEADPPSLPVLVINGVLAVAATAAAFILSYTMLLLVIKATGWSGTVAKIGPLVPDVAALAAAVMLVAQTKKMLGWLLLVGSTGMSIVGNLAGHAIERTTTTPQHGAALPGSWSLVGDAFSVFMPVVMAFLVHAFMDQLAAFLAWRKRQERQRQEQERQEQERRQRAAAAQAARKEALESLPKPQRKNELVSKDVAIQYGVAHEVHTPAKLGDALTKAGFSLRKHSAMKDYCREIKQKLGIA